MGYRNKIGVDEQENMSEEEFDIFCKKLVELESSYYIETISKLVANHLAIWLKYSRVEQSLENAIDLGKTGFSLSELEIKLLKRNVEYILKQEYSIEIIQENPLILESKVPFQEIEVK